jgi:hypothetical protein
MKLHNTDMKRGFEKRVDGMKGTRSEKTGKGTETEGVLVGHIPTKKSSFDDENATCIESEEGFQKRLRTRVRIPVGAFRFLAFIT